MSKYIQSDEIGNNFQITQQNPYTKYQSNNKLKNSSHRNNKCESHFKVPFLTEVPRNIPKKLLYSLAVNVINIPEKLSLGYPVGIVNGTINLYSKIFNTELRGKQSVAILYYTFAYTYVKKPNDWKTNTLDQLLYQGTELYKLSVKIVNEMRQTQLECTENDNILENDNTFENNNGKLDRKASNYEQLKTKENLLLIPYDNFVGNDECTEKQIIGDYDILKKFPIDAYTFELSVAKPSLVGRIESKDPRIPNIFKGLQIFFRFYNSAIFQCCGISILIWKDKCGFYVFDPHGRDGNCNSNEFDGFASLLVFAKIQNVTHLLLNLSGFASDTLFSLANIKIIKLLNCTTPHIPDIITKELIEKSYVIMNKYWAIVHGNFHLGDICFNYTKNRQALAICCVAIIYSKIDPPNGWTSKTVDKVLLFGNKFFKDCTSIEQPIEFTIYNIPALFTVGPYCIEMFIHPSLYRGTLTNAANYYDNEFRRAFECFFHKHHGAILQITSLYFAIWRKNSLYYLYDPYSRNLNGDIPNNKIGVACLHMHSTLQSLLNILLKNLAKIAIGHDFIIHALDVLNISKRDISNLKNERKFTVITANHCQTATDNLNKIHFLKTAQSFAESIDSCFVPHYNGELRDITKPLIPEYDLDSPSLSLTQIDATWDDIKKEVYGPLCDNIKDLLYRPEEEATNSQFGDTDSFDLVGDLATRYPMLRSSCVNMGIIKSKSCTMASIYKLMTTCFQCVDRCYIILKNENVFVCHMGDCYYLYSDCSCTMQLFRYLDFTNGTKGFQMKRDLLMVCNCFSKKCQKNIEDVCKLETKVQFNLPCNSINCTCANKCKCGCPSICEPIFDCPKLTQCQAIQTCSSTVQSESLQSIIKSESKTNNATCSPSTLNKLSHDLCKPLCEPNNSEANICSEILEPLSPNEQCKCGKTCCKPYICKKCCTPHVICKTCMRPVYCRANACNDKKCCKPIYCYCPPDLCKPMCCKPNCIIPFCCKRPDVDTMPLFVLRCPKCCKPKEKCKCKCNEEKECPCCGQKSEHKIVTIPGLKPCIKYNTLHQFLKEEYLGPYNDKTVEIDEIPKKPPRFTCPICGRKVKEICRKPCGTPDGNDKNDQYGCKLRVNDKKKDEIKVECKIEFKEKRKDSNTIVQNNDNDSIYEFICPKCCKAYADCKCCKCKDSKIKDKPCYCCSCCNPSCASPCNCSSCCKPCCTNCCSSKCPPCCRPTCGSCCAPKCSPCCPSKCDPCCQPKCTPCCPSKCVPCCPTKCSPGCPPKCTPCCPSKCVPCCPSKCPPCCCCSSKCDPFCLPKCCPTNFSACCKPISMLSCPIKCLPCGPSCCTQDSSPCCPSKRLPCCCTPKIPPCCINCCTSCCQTYCCLPFNPCCDTCIDLDPYPPGEEPPFEYPESIVLEPEPIVICAKCLKQVFPGAECNLYCARCCKKICCESCLKLKLCSCLRPLCVVPADDLELPEECDLKCTPCCDVACTCENPIYCEKNQIKYCEHCGRANCRCRRCFCPPCYKYVEPKAKEKPCSTVQRKKSCESISPCKCAPQCIGPVPTCNNSDVQAIPCPPKCADDASKNKLDIKKSSTPIQKSNLVRGLSSRVQSALSSKRPCYEEPCSETYPPIKLPRLNCKIKENKSACHSAIGCCKKMCRTCLRPICLTPVYRELCEKCLKPRCLTPCCGRLCCVCINNCACCKCSQELEKCNWNDLVDEVSPRNASLPELDPPWKHICRQYVQNGLKN